MKFHTKPAVNRITQVWECFGCLSMWYVEVLGMASTDEEAACQLKDVAMLVGD